MKAKITQNEHDGSVTLEYDDPDSAAGQRASRTFYCPHDGGYVRDGNHRQVCYGLSGRGPTLIANNHRHLLEVIRREWAAARRNADF